MTIREHLRPLVLPATLLIEVKAVYNDLAWGGWLLWHPTLFETGRAYARLLEQGAQEHVYGMRALTLGVLQLVALLWGRWMTFPAVLAAGLWFYLAIDVHRGNPVGVGPVHYSSAVLTNLLIVLFATRRRSVWAWLRD